VPDEHPLTTDSERIAQLREFSVTCSDLAKGFDERQDEFSARPFSILAKRANELLTDGWEQSDLKALGSDFPQDQVGPVAIDPELQPLLDLYHRSRELALQLRALATW